LQEPHTMSSQADTNMIPANGTGDTKYLTRALISVILAAAAGLVASQQDGVVAAIGVGVEIFVAAFAVGAVLGFLFAVPRVLAQASGAATPADDGRERSRFLQSNTNLESISDWLTTMLVGVGISQLYRVNDALFAFRNYTATSAGAVNGSAGVLPAISPLLLITGAVAGFIAMYLQTRVNLALVFNETEGFLRREDRRAVVSAARSIGDTNGTFVAAIASGGSVTPNDALDLMFDLLYKPEGYRRVIELAAQLSHSSIAKSAAYWFYLAAAFGQQLMHAREADDSKAAASARDNALDAARRAVRIDRSYRGKLWLISDPSSVDNDLSGLRDNLEFLSLVGPKPA